MNGGHEAPETEVPTEARAEGHEGQAEASQEADRQPTGAGTGHPEPNAPHTPADSTANPDDDIERIFSGEPLKGRGRRAREAARGASADEIDLNQTEWLSTQEAAQRLGITPRTLYRFIDQGDLPAYRFGRVIRLRAHEVERFVENSRIKPGELEHLYPEPVSREEDA